MLRFTMKEMSMKNLRMCHSWRSFALAGVLLIAGCGSASQNRLLVAATESIEACIDADAELKRSLLEQLGANSEALNSAFLADVNDLSDSEGKIPYDDLMQAKSFYDIRSAEITESRVRIEQLFLARLKMLEDVVALIDMARGDSKGEDLLQSLFSDDDTSDNQDKKAHQ